MMNAIFNLKKMLCLAVCLSIGVFCYHVLLSRDYANSSAQPLSIQSSSAQLGLIEERDQILDDLRKIESRIDALREQLAELEDSLLKKNERLAVVERQIGSLR